MQPSLWQPPVDLSVREEQIVKRIRKAKLFVFLRQHRHELLDEAFQQELASAQFLKGDSKRGGVDGDADWEAVPRSRAWPAR